MGTRSLRDRARRRRRLRGVVLVIALAGVGLSVPALLGLAKRDDAGDAFPAAPVPVAGPDRQAGPGGGDDVASGGAEDDGAGASGPEGPRRVEKPLDITLVSAHTVPRGGGVIVLRARNRGEAAISISDRAIDVTQRRGRILPVPFPNTAAKRFPPSIAPGRTATTTLYYPRLEPGGTVIRIPWWSLDPDRRTSPVEFRLDLD